MTSMPAFRSEPPRVSGRIRTPPLRRTFRFAFQSIRLRLGRCLVTTASVISAIAFLNYNALFLVCDSAPVVTAPRITADGEDFFSGLEQFTAEKSAVEKRLFVMALSLAVCFIGITNSMLMSIKERFREIATLKCLGAINVYIRQLFVIEALFQGGLGSVLGVLAGTLIFLVVVGSQVSFAGALGVGAACVLGGAVMTVLAAAWPIREALAMLPIEALRVEE